MNSKRSIRSPILGALLFAALASACAREDEKAVKGREGPNGTPRDTVSDVALDENGLGPVQIGMTLDEAVSMGLLNERPDIKPACDFVYPAVGSGVPFDVGVMVVKGKVARIDVDTGSVTTEDGAKIGDSEDRVKSIYGDELEVRPHKFIDGGHYLIVKGDSTSAGKEIVFETDGSHKVIMFRAGRLPEVEWLEGCG